MSFVISALVMSFVIIVMTALSPPGGEDETGLQFLSYVLAGVLAGLISYILLTR